MDDIHTELKRRLRAHLTDQESLRGAFMKRPEKELFHEELDESDAIDKRNDNRRKVPAKGFAHILIAGWICRQERCRRKDDKMYFFT